MADVAQAKENGKKKQLMEDIEQEQKIWNQLHDMREEYITEEKKKGNTDVTTKLNKIDMIPPPKKDQLQSILEKQRDRSKNKSKSPSPNRNVP